MKQNYRRVCTFILAATILFTQTGSTVFAAETTEGVTEWEQDSTQEAEQPSGTTEATIEKTEKTTETSETTETAETEEATETTETTETTEETQTTETAEETQTTEMTTGEEDKDIFPEMKESYCLSSAQLHSKEELKTQLGEIERYSENIDYKTGEVICFADSAEEAKQIALSYGCLEDNYNYSYGILVLQLPNDISVIDAVNAAADEQSNLVAVWPNYIYSACEQTEETDEEEKASESQPTEEVGEEENVTESQPTGSTQRIYQWHHDVIGDRYSFEAGYTGEGIKVAVLDTGLRINHEDLDDYCVTGRDFVDGAAGLDYSDDPDGHGTHVAGIIGANYNQIGGYGIAMRATIRGYRVLEAEGKGNDADIIRGIYAATEDGNDIINMSFGSRKKSQLMQDAISSAYEKGVAVFAAAGNDGSNAFVYPASCEHVFSVAALEQSRSIASFSNYSSTVDFAFPGVDIVSTWSDDTILYKTKDGTSMAAPMAAGTAAVLLSASEDIAALKDKKGSQRVDALEKVMRASAVRISSQGTGSGTVYLPKALGLSTLEERPKAPVFVTKPGIYYESEVFIATEPADGTILDCDGDGKDDVIWIFSRDGKTPGYRNGKMINAYKGDYEGYIKASDKRHVVVKLMAVNVKTGLCSPVVSATYTLIPTPTKVEISSQYDNRAVTKGRTLSLKAKVYPDYSSSTKVAWSVSPQNKGVTVKNGVVRTTSWATPGEYIITAQAVGKDGKTYNGVKEEFKIEVTEAQKIKSIRFAQKAYTLNKTDLVSNPKIDISSDIKITDMKGNTLSRKNISWFSSNEKVATVEDGVITAQFYSGTAKITAVANDGSGRSATTSVSVIQAPASYIFVDMPEKMSLARGKQMQFEAATKRNVKIGWSITPADKNITLAASGVRISANGRVSASARAKPGTYLVTAMTLDGSKLSSKPYSLQVTSGGITSIKLNQKTLTLFTTSGNTGAVTSATLDASVKGADGYDQNMYIYSSSNPEIVEVTNEKTGEIYAMGRVGRAVISCTSTDGTNRRATCVVTVKNPMSSLGISPKNGLNYCVGKGSSLALVATCGNAYGKPTDRRIIWSSKNPDAATVSTNGVVRGIKPGYIVEITAKAADGSGVEATYSVTVTDRVKKMTIEMDKENEGVLEIKTDPELTSSSYVVTISGKEGMSVAKKCLNKYFMVPTKEGTYTIKMKLLDGSNRSASIRVKAYKENGEWKYK